MLMQGMQDLLLKSEPLPLGAFFGRRAILREAPDKPSEKVRSNIGDGIQSRRLIFLEAGVVEDLADGAFQGRSTDPGRHQGTIF